MIIMFEVELANLLGIIPPSTKKRKQPLEEDISHVLEKHEDQPSIRMQAKIIKKEINET